MGAGELLVRQVQRQRLHLAADGLRRSQGDHVVVRAMADPQVLAMKGIGCSNVGHDLRQQPAVPHHGGAHQLGAREQQRQRHDAALAEAAHHHMLGRHAQLAGSRGQGLRQQGAALRLLRFVDGAFAVGLDGEIKPCECARPHAERRAQAEHMERFGNLRRQAIQVVLVAAHAVHQHEQPGMAHRRICGTVLEGKWQVQHGGGSW